MEQHLNESSSVMLEIEEMKHFLLGPEESEVDIRQHCDERKV